MDKSLGSTDRPSKLFAGAKLIQSGIGAAEARSLEPMRSITVDDFWSLKTVNDVQLSPDGKKVAYVVGICDPSIDKVRSIIWVADLTTLSTRALTSGEAQDTQPRWSPQGQQLAFVSTRHDDKPQIYAIDLSGGEARRLTTMADGASSPVWAPDSRRICFASTPGPPSHQVHFEESWFEGHRDADTDGPRMRRHTALKWRSNARGYLDRPIHLFLVDTDTAAALPMQLTYGGQDDLQATWSPDGALVAFVSNRTAESEHNLAADVWTVAVDTGELTCLTDGTLTAECPAWAPDGRMIAFYATLDATRSSYRDAHVWTVPRLGGPARELSALLDRSVRFINPDYMLPVPCAPSWSPDGRTVYFCAVDQVDSAVFAIDIADGAVRRVSSSPGDVASVACSGDGNDLVCLAATPTTPFDVFAVAAAGGELRPLLNTNRALVEAVALSSPATITFKGSDGWDIQGLMIKPVETPGPYPLILVIHGGPDAAWARSFMFFGQVLAGAGYASLYINPRGSLGYGQRFSDAADWGGKDYEDLMAGLDAVLLAGQPIDRERLGVMGLSYGGFMTNWVLGHTDRFAGGVSINGVSNLISFYGTSDFAAHWFEQRFGGPFWTSGAQLQRYWQHSPIAYVDRIRTPLLLIQSEDDFRCPIEQGEQMLTALRVRHQVVELVRVPGASHLIAESGRPHQRYVESKLTLDWFERHVKTARPKPE